MTAIEYLTEDGQGRYAPWYVSDLVPESAGETEIAFVFESPHVRELEAGVPVVGPSGRAALRFLMPEAAVDESLGCFVQRRLSVGDGRVAILNVSMVPMQGAAFVGMDAPDLAEEEWALIAKVRRSTSRSPDSMRDPAAKEASIALHQGLGTRIRNLAAERDFRVVAAGAFAQRMMHAIQDELPQPMLCVPHPSFNQWNRATNMHRPGLVESRALFERLAR
ncbi:MAG: hypothetical protein LCH60_14680 [Actinobacteria bacterium]|nr:hypothetical protein [Actinomycetota bacterium]